jgi:DNA-binding transcriptional MerR regulator
MNAEQVGRLLGISAKTVHRHIARGTITATYLHKQELSIPDDQVEKLRQILASDTSRQMSDTSQAMSRQLEELTERVTEQEQRIASLERQVESLQSSAVDAKNRPVSSAMGESTRAAYTSPKNAATEASKTASAELPSGTLSAAEFAAKIGVEYDHFKNYIKRGVSGERLAVTEIAHHSRAGYTQKYLTPEQQEKAFEILKRHNKLKENE